MESEVAVEKSEPPDEKDETLRKEEDADTKPDNSASDNATDEKSAGATEDVLTDTSSDKLQMSTKENEKTERTNLQLESESADKGEDSCNKGQAMKPDLSPKAADDTERASIMKNHLQGVLHNLNTNDSPIQAVDQLTNVDSYTVQWRPSNSNSTRVDDQARSNSAIVVSSANSQAIATVHGSSSGTSSPVANEVGTTDDNNDMELIESEPCESKSKLELTVGKLKISQANGTISTTSDGASSNSKVPLPSSAPPDYLQELLYRSQLNKRKGRPDNPFSPKLSPPSIFRGGVQVNRRGKPLRNLAPKVVPVSTVSTNNSVVVSTPSLDLSANVNVAKLPYPVNNKLSSEDRYVINRTPLRKLAPKPNAPAVTQALTVAIGPTTPPTSLTRSPQVTSPQLLMPVSMPSVSTKNSPTPATINSHSRSPVATAHSQSQQDQPLDLCTKSATNSEASSPPSSPSASSFDENEPMDLSKDKSKPSPKVNNPPRQLPPSSSGFWKTPPRGSMMGFHKPGGTSSPLEGDTASDTAANSPGLDNRKLPYGFIMSPEMIKGVVHQMGGITHPSQIIPDGYPEGAILLPGSGPHYRLPRNIALQHDEPPTPERPYMCDQCGATFKRNKSLNQHLRVHFDQSLQTHAAGKQQQGKAQTEIKPHACDVCPRRFVHHEQLKRHARIHREGKTFICENKNCGKKFNDSSQLRLHMRTHSDHKPFPCPYCTLRFKYSGDVKRHVRIHTGEKPYVCGYCKMRFTQSNTLKQHERTHTGERPYHCHKCGMTFTQSGSLKYHLAHRHPPDVQTIIVTSGSQTLTSASPMMQVMNQNGVALK